MILLGNIDREPDMPKFRTLRTTNRSMTKLLGQPSVEPLLKLAGFRDEDGVLVFPADAPLEQLRSVLVAIAEEPSSASSSAAAEPQPEVEPTSPATSPAASTAAEDQLRALLRGSSPDSPQRDSSPGTPSAAAAVPCTTAAPAEDQLRELLKSGTATPVARPRIRVDNSPLQRVAAAGGTPLVSRLKRQSEPEPEPEPELEPDKDNAEEHREEERRLEAARAAEKAKFEVVAEKERLANEKKVAAQEEAARVAAEQQALKAEQERLAAQRAEQERLAAEQAAAEAARVVAEKAAAEEAVRKAKEVAEAAAAAAAVKAEQEAELASLLTFSSVPTKQAVTLMGGLAECERAKSELGDLRGVIGAKLQEAEHRHKILQQRLRALQLDA
eukprot:COSAG06_NODE_3206_length_5684_cov_4.900286_2_plen_386_part_00